MDSQVQFIDDVKPLQDTELLRVRGVDGVQWAMPLYKGSIRARLDNGTFQTCMVLGLDDATLIGGPPEMVQGKIEDLRRAEAVIIDSVGAADKLAKILPDGRHIPLKVGDTMELNDHRAIVVGICNVTRTWQSLPVIYTTYSRATTFAPQERKLLSFVLVKARPGISPAALCGQINQQTGLAAYTRQQFIKKTRQLLPGAHRDSDQLRHFRRPRIHRRHRDRRADVLQLHARQPAPLRRPQGDGRAMDCCCA